MSFLVVKAIIRGVSKICLDIQIQWFMQLCNDNMYTKSYSSYPAIDNSNLAYTSMNINSYDK